MNKSLAFLGLFAFSSSFASSIFLKSDPINEYHCFSRVGTPGDTGNPTSNSNVYDHAINNHYYFLHNPGPLPATANGYNFCHDLLTYGLTDSLSFNRLGLHEQAFQLFTKQDTRFLSNSSGELPINRSIANKLLFRYGISSAADFFQPLNVYDSPVLADGSNPHPKKTLGFYLKPVVDPDTQLALCPTTYNMSHSKIPLMRILREYINEDTEALYRGVREVSTYRDRAGSIILNPRDEVFVNERTLKNIAFFYENGTPQTPSDIEYQQKTILFYWPANPINPFVKQSGQALYVIKHPEEDQSYFIPHDRRFACVPKNLVTYPSTLKDVGVSCYSDLACKSSCCGFDGTCRVHNPLASTPVFCSKPPGTSCLAKEWCRQDTVNVCKVYRVGTTPTGAPTCALRCLPTSMHGDCVGNVCQPVAQPTPEPFDPNDQAACNSAPDFPND